MASRALFAGLIVDEKEHLVEMVSIGGEAFYIVDDDGFKRHVESEHVDREVLSRIFALMEGQEEFISENTMKMLGQDDIFTKAAIEQSLKTLDEQVDELLQVGLPDDSMNYLGMMGFRVMIDHHGDVLEISQPGMLDPDDT